MKIIDEQFERINALYKNADRYVSINHRIASQKYQVFGQDAMSELKHIYLSNGILRRQNCCYLFLSTAITFYHEPKEEYTPASKAQVASYLETEQGQKWNTTLEFFICRIYRSSMRRLRLKSLDFFDNEPKSSKCKHIGQHHHIKAIVSQIRYLAKDVQNEHVLWVDFKTQKRLKAPRAMHI